MLATSAAHAQPKLLDCSCLATQAVLFNSACCGFIPDLCTVVSNCYTPSISPAPGYVCTQTPLPGTFVCSNTPITFTLTETNSAAFSDTCSNLVFYVGVSASPFMLLCGPTQVVPCNSTTWSFPPPGWTNTCCTNPITLIGPTLVTNWPVITATWVGIDCNSNVDSCNDTILFSSSNGVCNCLDIFCPSNIVVQTCFSGLAGSTNFGFTNISYPFPVASNYCIGVITNITCTPISGSPFPVGTNTVTCTVYDNLGNSASCTFDIIVLGNTTPPTVICGPNQTVQCGSVWAPIPPTAFSACCTNFTIMLVSAVTNTSSTCLETIDFWWHVTDCNNNFADCTNTVTVVDTTPPVINCRSNYTIQCANTAGTTNGWQAFPPSAFDACCGIVAVTLINVVTNSGVVPCNGNVTLTWQATDCCSNTATCTEVATIVDTNPPTINCAGPKSVECGTGWTFDPPTAFDSCCGSNVTITVVSNITVFSSPCMSIYTRVWRATDCCTNAAFCSQTVTEIDTQPPVMSCGSNFTVNCGTIWNFTPPTAIDACCGTNVTITIASTTKGNISLIGVDYLTEVTIADMVLNGNKANQTIGQQNGIMASTTAFR